MKNELFKEIALQAGGSHYPEVGGEKLELFAKLLLEEVIKTIHKTPVHCAVTTYDLGVVECTIQKSIEAIENKFGMPHNYELEHENRPSVRSPLRVSGH